MRLPDFLVIGAMKSGTTTFYHDLATHPQIYLAEKELGALTRDVSAGEYAACFAGAKINQLCGDVSTSYSMLPDVSGVVERAKRSLSPSTKILYLVREPVQRAISHHYHYQSLLTDKRMEADINECVYKHPSLINYGKYGEQLAHWSSHLGGRAFHVIHFEDYVANRQKTMKRVFNFLGLRPAPRSAPMNAIHNASAGKPVLNGFWRRVTQHGLYRQLVRPYFSLAARDRVRAAVLPAAPPPPAPPRPDVIEHLVSIFAADSEVLCRLANGSAPFWNFDAVRAAHIERYHRWQSAGELRKSA